MAADLLWLSQLGVPTQTWPQILSLARDTQLFARESITSGGNSQAGLLGDAWGQHVIFTPNI